jgi:hypothetical protein
LGKDFHGTREREGREGNPNLHPNLNPERARERKESQEVRRREGREGREGIEKREGRELGHGGDAQKEGKGGVGGGGDWKHFRIRRRAMPDPHKNPTNLGPSWRLISPSASAHGDSAKAAAQDAYCRRTGAERLFCSLGNHYLHKKLLFTQMRSGLQ